MSRNNEKDLLKNEVKRIYSKMEELDPESKEYGYCAEHLKDLLSCKDDKNFNNKINPNTVLIVLTNLAGIVLCCFREETTALTSKAFSFIIKPKI